MWYGFGLRLIHMYVVPTLWLPDFSFSSRSPSKVVSKLTYLFLPRVSPASKNAKPSNSQPSSPPLSVSVSPRSRIKLITPRA